MYGGGGVGVESGGNETHDPGLVEEGTNPIPVVIERMLSNFTPEVHTIVVFARYVYVVLVRVANWRYGMEKLQKQKILSFDGRIAHLTTH